MKYYTEKDATEVLIIDKGLKNKWNWNWLSTTLTLDLVKTGRTTVTFSQFFRKIEAPGKVRCIICNSDINYGPRGKVALRDHTLANTHKQKLDLKLDLAMTTPSIESMLSNGASTSESTSVMENVKVPVPLFDRVSNAESQSVYEAMLLGVVAESSLPLTMAPVLVDVAIELSKDKAALARLQLSRTTASYKMTEGLALTFTERVLQNLQRVPFSMNIDESTSNNNKKVLAILVSFFNPDSQQVDVEHLESVEVLHVNAAKLHTTLSESFERKNIPWSNLVSLMMDSCAVMRGSKSGLETRIRQTSCPGLLDIDGDSCHHIHNTAKFISKPFENWLESLFLDLHTDHQWASDQLANLQEISELCGLPCTNPQRFVSHRWLSAYDVALGTKRMMTAYKVMYYGFLSNDDKETYKAVLEDIYRQCGIGAKGRDRVKAIHKSLAGKGMTDAGKERKKRIIKKVLHQDTTTDLYLSFYLGVLAILKQYVMIFQGNNTLVHKLHDQQTATFTHFLACFIKAEHLQKKTPQQLVQMDVSDQKIQLSPKDMYVGETAAEFVKNKPKDAVVLKFLKTVKEAYTSCAAYMQKKLPLDSETLQALSALDPLVRGHSVGSKQLKKLSTKLKAHLPADNSVLSEITKFSVDEHLPPFADGDDIVPWWAHVFATDRYPSLSMVAKAALSCFHGPRVESSFNVMGDIIDPKSCRLNISTYSAFQTVKYHLKARNTTALQYFQLKDKFGPVDKKLCKNMRSAAGRYKKNKQEKAQAKLKRQQEFGCARKTESAQACKRRKEADEKQARIHHAERERKRARERALKTLADKRAKKKK